MGGEDGRADQRAHDGHAIILVGGSDQKAVARDDAWRGGSGLVSRREARRERLQVHGLEETLCGRGGEKCGRGGGEELID